MRCPAFFQQCFHRIKQVVNIEKLNQKIRVAWAENSDTPLTFQNFLDGFTSSTDPIMNFITKGEVAVTRNSIVWFIFLNINLFFATMFQVIDLCMKRNDFELVDIVNRGKEFSKKSSGAY